MDFKQITSEQQTAAKNKFLEYGRGIIMNKYVGIGSENATESKWHDLVKPGIFGESAITTRMKGLAQQINTSCDDPILGDTDVLFVHTTEMDEEVKFTYEDAYLFLRAVIEYRRNSAEYRAAKKEIAELEDFLNKNKTAREKRKEAVEKLNALKGQL